MANWSVVADARCRSGFEMKILLVAPFGLPAYGVSPYANSLCAALLHPKKRVPKEQIITLDFQSAYPKAFYPSEMPRRTRRSGIHWAKPWTWDFKSTDVQIAHIQYWTSVTAPYLIPFVDRLKARGIRVVLTLHNVTPHERSGLLINAERRLLSRADIIVSHFKCSNLKNQFGERLAVIPHGIEIQEILSPSDNDYDLTGLSRKKRYCLYFGNIRPYKGVIELLQAWQQIARLFPDHELIIAGRTWVGTGIGDRLSGAILGLTEFNKKFIEAKSKAKVFGVRFINTYLSDEYIDACCRIAELSVFPYLHFAAQSGAATRVAGFGQRLLVSDAGALPELVSDSRFIFNAGNTEQLCSRLSALLNDTEEGIAADRERQLRHIYSQSWPEVADKHLELYRRLMDKR